MRRIEDEIRELIIERYSSIPKFAKAIGLPEQTVYSVLRNGILVQLEYHVLFE